MPVTNDELQGAYRQYLEWYALKHPRPERRRAERGDQLVRRALILVVLSSIFVSATRTISEFAASYQAGTLIGAAAGVAAFVMIELGIVAYAYIRTKHRYEQGANVSMGRLIDAGMYLSLVVALVGNADFVLQSDAQVLQTTVNILLAVSAPLLAFISGDILGVLEVTRRKAQAELDAQYQQELAAWMEAANADFNANRQYAVQVYRASLSGGVRQSSDAVRLPSDTGQPDAGQDNRTMDRTTGHGRTRNRTALDILREYRDNYPDKYRQASLSKLARELNISRSTLGDARKKLEQEQVQ